MATVSDTEKAQAASPTHEEDKVTMETPPAETAKELPSSLSLGVIVGSVMMAIWLTTLDQTIVSTAIPKITNTFHGLLQVSWYGAVYFLTLGTFRPFWGKVCKLLPLKPLFLLTIAIFELGSLICGVAPNSTAFIIGRAITGVGGAGIATGGTTVVALSTPPKQRPKFMAFLGVAASLGNIVGPLIGGAFADKVTWRWCFWINLPVGGIVAGLILIFLKLETGAKTADSDWKQAILHMDLVGLLLSIAGMVCFILPLQYAGVRYPWKSSEVIGLLVGFVLIEGALGIWEYHMGRYALLPRRLMKQRTLWATFLFQFFFAGSYFLILYYLPIYFQSVLRASPLQSGVDNVPLLIAFAIFILAGGFTVSKTGYATPFMAVGAALTCVAAGLFYTMSPETHSAKWIGYQVLAGAAIAFPYMNCLSLAQAYVDDGDISVVSSIVQYFQTLGGAFSTSVAESAFVNQLITTLPSTAPGVDPTSVTQAGAAELRTMFSASQLPGIIEAYNIGVRAAFAVAIGMGGIAVVLSLFCPWSSLPTHTKNEEEEKT